jgi:multiple sugar transport system substrate-binding protein
MFLLGSALLFIGAILYDRPYVPPKVEGQVNITYWEKWTGFEGAAMAALVDKFNEAKIRNDKGEVIYCRYLPTTQVDRKAMLAIAGGNPPEAVGFWSQNTHTFADRDALLPLDPFIERDHFDMTKYLPVYEQGFRHRGKIWALCTTPASVALHWNKDLFKEAGLDPERPPRTLEELEEFAEKISKKDDTGRVVRVGFLPPEPGWWNWAWGYWFGGKLNDGLEKITADDPKNIEALTWILRFANKYGKPEAMLAFRQGFGSFDSPQNAFLAGKVGMVLQGVWMHNFIRFHNPHMNYGVAPFPASFDAGDDPVTVAEMDVIIIPRGTKHPEEAWKLIEFINSREGLEFVCGKQGKLTPLKENTPGWVEHHQHPHVREFIRLARSKNAVSTPKVAVWMEYRADLNEAFDQIWLGSLTPEQAMRRVQDYIQPKLDRALRARRAREEAGIE